jgi:hypothetical protein
MRQASERELAAFATAAFASVSGGRLKFEREQYLIVGKNILDFDFLN